MTNNSPLVIRRLATVAGLALLAACQSVPPPPPPPAPTPTPRPTVVEAVPSRPVPPAQAPYAMDIPGRDATGRRMTVNTNLDANTTIWHFRSGWNVAALNCQGAQYEVINTGYTAFLNRFSRGLTTANTALDRAYAASEGSSRAGIAARERRMTSVYNYFSQPTARTAFCDTALAVATELAASPPPAADLTNYATASLARYEAAFETFYAAYEQYRTASAAWDARYGAQHGPSQPGWVAVHGTSGT